MFGLNDLEGQLRRLQVFLDYCDNTKQELETLNLVAQRNIPVTFTSPAAVVINDTLEPAVSRDTESNPGARAGKPKSPGFRQTKNWILSVEIARCFRAPSQGNS